MPNIKKDDEYYLSSSIFLVEDTLFKFPTYMLESQSCVFNTMFTLPAYNGDFEGQVDDRPIRLEGITKAEFGLLLKVAYPKQFGFHIQLSEEEWLSVLGLSTRWAMDGIHALVVETLNTFNQNSPHKLITLGKQYDISDWIFTGADILVRREKPLGEEDVTSLGIAEVLRLASIRECLSNLRSQRDTLNRGRGTVSCSPYIDAKIQALYGLQSVPSEKNRPPLWDICRGGGL